MSVEDSRTSSSLSTRVAKGFRASMSSMSSKLPSFTLSSGRSDGGSLNSSAHLDGSGDNETGTHSHSHTPERPASLPLSISTNSINNNKKSTPKGQKLEVHNVNL